MNDKKKERLETYVDSEFANIVRESARKLGISISSFIEEALLEKIERLGETVLDAMRMSIVESELLRKMDE